MNHDYRKALIETADYLIDVRHNLFVNALNVAMKNELNEIDQAFEEGDTFEFELKHLDNSNDPNLQKLVDLIRNIEKTVDYLTNVNNIEDSELDQKATESTKVESTESMNTKYAEVETICLTGNDAIIASNVMLEGFNYSEPTYTNVFCDKEQLIAFLKGEPGLISKQVFNEIMNELDLSKTLQINLHDLNENKPWVITQKLLLKPVSSEVYGFTCYNLVGAN